MIRIWHQQIAKCLQWNFSTLVSQIAYVFVIISCSCFLGIKVMVSYPQINWNVISVRVVWVSLMTSAKKLDFNCSEIIFYIYAMWLSSSFLILEPLVQGKWRAGRTNKELVLSATPEKALYQAEKEATKPNAPETLKSAAWGSFPSLYKYETPENR